MATSNRLSDLISGSDRETTERACALIAEFLPMVPRVCKMHEGRAAHEDTEYRVTHALYLAAYTHDPCRSGFVHWSGTPGIGRERGAWSLWTP